MWAFACEADLTRGPDVAFADDIGGWLSRDGGVKLTEARRHAARPRSCERRSCGESAPLGQGSRTSLLVDLPCDEMALLIELVVHLCMN